MADDEGVFGEAEVLTDHDGGDELSCFLLEVFGVSELGFAVVVDVIDGDDGAEAFTLEVADGGCFGGTCEA